MARQRRETAVEMFLYKIAGWGVILLGILIGMTPGITSSIGSFVFIMLLSVSLILVGCILANVFE